jgi:hypothetical protein
MYTNFLTGFATQNLYQVVAGGWIGRGSGVVPGSHHGRAVVTQVGAVDVHSLQYYSVSSG